MHSKQRLRRCISTIRLTTTISLLLVLTLAGTVSLAQPRAGTPAAPARRNVLLLVSDDQGRDALGAYGNPAIKTPNQDRLAADGIRFTQAFATVASCSPSRSVIYSGLHQHTNGHYGLAHAAHNQKSQDFVRSLPRLLNEHGYRTGIIGKDHIKPDDLYPFQLRAPQGSRNVAQMAQKAREVFTATDARPFFLVIGYSDPHRANQGFANEVNYPGIERIKYDPAAVRVPYFLPDTPEVRQELAEYYESVSRLDQGIGLVLKALQESGKLEETLVIYLSDNGIPFPGAKTNLYDPGIHLPLLIRAPGQAKRGLVNHAMVSWLDITPTILDWAGVKAPYPLPGRSLLPILGQAEPAGWDTVFASHTMHEITMYYPMRAIRTRNHKLIWNLAHQLTYPQAQDLWESRTWQGILKRGDGQLGLRRVEAYEHRPEFELYDLAKDPQELRSVYGQPAYAATARQLREQLLQMMRETKDPWLVTLREKGL